MENYLFLPRNAAYEEVSSNLGFTKTFFQEDFLFIEEQSPKHLLQKLSKCQKKVIFRPATEEMIRFAIEKTPISIILGAEKIYAKDSLHYPRSGLDHILCTLAAERGKIIAFSFSDILNAVNREKLLYRMIFNIKLCRKYKVKTLFSTFAKTKEEMRSAKDLEAFWRVLPKRE